MVKCKLLKKLRLLRWVKKDFLDDFAFECFVNSFYPDNYSNRFTPQQGALMSQFSKQMKTYFGF